jgi:hypothetical protein
MVIGAVAGLALGILVSVLAGVPLAPEGGLALGLLAGWRIAQTDRSNRLR